ncbi:MAG TPA: alpha/beta fold hydrolase, partial [Gaiellales bacterium]|nr:alpha/beta fold hydrolase [Gaiellales bacterium]
MTFPDHAMLRREAQALTELTALRLDPVYLGAGLPRGRGGPVLVLPGLFGNDLYLQPLRGWLLRLGYRPMRSTIALNAGCPNRLREQVEAELRARRPRSGPVALIGHSRGGMLAWALASRLQSDAACLALLGSPAGAVVGMLRRGDSAVIPSISAAASVVKAGQQAMRMLDPHCTFPTCGCPYPEDLRRPLSPTTR